MKSKRTPGRSLDEWMQLVTECRQSGLTDAAWCHEHDISPSCFYNAVSRLRKSACQIPPSTAKSGTFDLTAHRQDVVQIAIEPEDISTQPLYGQESEPVYTDDPHTIEIKAKGLLIHLSNSVHPALLRTLIESLKESLG